MPLIETHKPGSFCWFELATTDQTAAKNFYSSLFGWSFNDSQIGPGDFYSIFRLNGNDTAAAFTMRPEQQSQGMPPNWLLYVAVENADVAARRASELGGKICAPAFDVFDAGRMAVIADPTGAAFAVWQANRHKGVTIFGENGAACWADLRTHHPAEARHFYHELFGWSFVEGEQDHSGYLHIKNGEQFIGGISPGPGGDTQIPPHWLIYFQVSECDATAAKAKGLGAQFFVEPASMSGVGRFAVLKDPQGAVFALFQPESR